MNDLITWLRGVLDDDERVAKAATPGPWSVHRQGLEAVVSPGVAMDKEEGGVSVEDAAHIARHDPAAVLADVKAKRAVLDLLNLTAGPYDPARGALKEAVKTLASAYRHRPGWTTDWE